LQLGNRKLFFTAHYFTACLSLRYRNVQALLISSKKPAYPFTSAAFGNSLIGAGIKGIMLDKPEYNRITKLKHDFLKY